MNNMRLVFHLLKKCFLVFCILISYDVVSQVINVKQDGTGDFTQIQVAVEAAYNGDTILVWPGEYNENVIIENKYLTVGSLFLTTNDESYINSTSINGNETGSGIAVVGSNDTTEIVGLSIINGSGYPVYPDVIVGGGISIYEASTEITKCNITGNAAHDGGGGISFWRGNGVIVDCNINNNYTRNSAGGIRCSFESIVHLSSSRICNNHAFYAGGGISITSDSEIVFDSVNLSNIYLNYASTGCDIHKSSTGILSKVIVDTFTVVNPNTYFLSSTDDHGFQMHDIELITNAQKITPYDGDLYVNPVAGNDNNLGISPETALKTIAFAYINIKVDSSNNNTIHLAEGVYSDSANGEKFPLNIRPYIVVQGKNQHETILDGMYKSFLFKGNNEISGYSIKNLVMQRGTMIDYFDTFNNTDLFVETRWENNDIIFDSILFRNGIGDAGRAGLGISSSNNVTISNCIFENINGIDIIDIASGSGDTTYITNCIFNNNKPDYNNPDWIYGRPLRLRGAHDPENPFTNIVQNCLFVNNDENSFLSTMGTAYFINNTFVDNSNVSVSGISFNNWAAIGFMYNCITINNGHSPFFIADLDGIYSDFYVFNSCVEKGEESFTVNQGSTLFYDDTNIDDDPLFYYGSEYPYNLSQNSPCIDKGTLNIPDWIEIYEYDLAGNPRIYGDSIDMGAYEWNPTVGVRKILSKNEPLIVAPNPFSDHTTLSLTCIEHSNLKLKIYNSSGQCIKEFDQLQSNSIYWDGTNELNIECPQGLYFAILSSDNIVIGNAKIVKIR